MEERLNIPSVTGTDLEFKVAGPGGRSYAFVIDWHIRLLLALAWMLAVSAVIAGAATLFDDDSNFTAFGYIAGIPALAIYLLYHPILEILMGGRTPGKRMAGIRIVTRDGQNPSVGAHLVRNIFRLVDALPSAYLIGLMTTVLTEKNVRLGDMAAGTLLIYDAADEATTLKEVEAIYGSSIGIQESELVQEMISRWKTLEPETRSRLGRKLLQKLDVDVQRVYTDDDILSALKTRIG